MTGDDRRNRAPWRCLAAVLLLISVAAIGFAVTSRRGADRARAQLDELEHARPPDRAAQPARVRAPTSSGRPRRDAKRTGARLGLLLFELNRYGAINETYGHETGDTLMTSVDLQIWPALGAGRPALPLQRPAVRR